jgi:hypothetical protein
MRVKLDRKGLDFLLFCRLRLEARGNPDEYLARLRARLVDDNLVFPTKPGATQGSFVGRVADGRFRFAWVEWFSGKLNPICAGRVRTEGEALIVDATVQAVPLIVVLVAIVSAASVLTLNRGGHLGLMWLAPPAILSVITVRMVLSFKRGVADIMNLLTGAFGAASPRQDWPERDGPGN